jgi:type I restriction enzyme S subunit
MNKGAAVKAGWQRQTLGQLCRLISGQHIDSKDYNTESRGVGYLTGPSDFGPLNPVVSKWTEHPKIKAASGDILITVKGSGVGKINLLDQDEVAISRQLMAVRVKGADPRFVHAFLSSTFDHFQSLSTGAAIPGISREQVLGLEIPIPPLPEQQRIVGILDEAFDGIATAKANAEKNLQNTRALFEGHLQEVFTQRGKGWVEKPLGTLAGFRNGINYTKDSKGERVKIVGVKDFQKSYWVPSQNLDTVTIDGKLGEQDCLRQGDILAVRSNGNIDLIGRCILARDVPGKISHSGFTIRIRLSTGEVLPEFLCHFMKCTATRKRLTEGGTGTNIKSLNQQMLSALVVPFPSASQQKALVARLESISVETKRLESTYQQKLAALDALKKSLLDQAFTGAL